MWHFFKYEKKESEEKNNLKIEKLNEEIIKIDLTSDFY